MKHLFLYLYLAFVISLSILVLLSFLFTQQSGSMMQNTRAVEDAHRSLYNIQVLDSYIKDIELNARGYIISRDSLYLHDYQSQWSRILSHIDTVGYLVNAEEKQRNKLAMIHSNLKLRANFADRILEKAVKADTAGLSSDLVHNNRLFDQLRKEVKELENGERELLNAHFKRQEFYEKITPEYVKGILLFTIFIVVLSFVFLNREIRRRLKYQKQLENKIRELHRSNHELEQIAHVASHDLQEPLRKIRTFSNRLLTKQNEVITEEGKLILSRIDASAIRMHELINDVVNFTNLIHSTEQASGVELDKVVESAIAALKEEVSRSNAVIHLDTLPVIQGYPNQLFLLFRSLIENSLKFSKEGVRPEIFIRSHKSHKEKQITCSISIEDNGIGFDNAFGEKIFILFQRLHGEHSGYKGKGIGLSIVQRVMVNHQGNVVAKGTPGKGAIFTLYFPNQPA